MIKRLFEQGLLKAYTACPVCGHGERASVKRRPYYDRYIQALARELDVTPEDIMVLFQTFGCGQCGSIYCDPWLTAQGMNKLYGCGHSQHILGWHDFYSWVQETPDHQVRYNNARLWQFLVEKLGPLETYGQVNCPFSGLLMYFKGRELDGKNKLNYVAGKIAGAQRTYLHPHKAGHWLNRLVRAWGRIAVRGAAGKLIREEVNFGNVNRMPESQLRDALRFAQYRRRREKNPEYRDQPQAPLPQRRYLVYETTPCFWNTNCVSMNTTCRGLAQSVLDTPVIDVHDAQREGVRFDLLGLFNCLDHFIEPKRVLNACLALSRAVFIEVHKNEKNTAFSRQHLYAFGKDFLPHIVDPGWHIEDVTEIVQKKGQNCYLVYR